jgi:hypothetical protein
MPPVPRELHVDRWLTNLSLAYWQDSRDFVSDKVFPVISVTKQSDKYIIYDRGSFWRDQMAPRPLGGRADVADWSKTEGQYLCVERALAHMIDDRQRANTDQPLNPDRAGMQLLTHAAAINNDNRWGTEYFAPSIWTTDLEGAADAGFTQIADTSTGSPIELIDQYKEVVKELTTLTPNTVVVGAKVHRILRNHTKLKEVFKYTQTAILDEDLIARTFGIDNYYVTRSVVNAAREGQADDIAFAHDTLDVLMCYAAPSPGLETPSAGYSFAWTGLLPGATNAFGGVVMRGREDFAHSDILEIRTANDIKLVSADLGVFFNTFVA